MLASRIGSFDDLRVADLFAGSGALGLEALSRGASHATFVENDRLALEAIRANIAALKAGASADVRPLSATSLPPTQSFDLVLADPPYAVGSGTSVVNAVRGAGWLVQGGWLAIETDAHEAVDAGDWAINAERRVGRARLTLIRA